MSPPPLPLECLQHIISHIAEQNDVQTLARFLRVNRFVCLATLPILYSNPFKNAYHDNKTGPNASKSRLKLAQTLLRQAQPERRTNLLRMMVLGDTEAAQDTQVAYTSVINYLPYLRELDLSRLLDIDGIGHELPALPRYLEQSPHSFNLFEQYQEVDTSALYGIVPYTNSRTASLHMDVNRQLLWSLCCPDTIQNLTIPLYDLDRYLNIVREFKVLASVTFMVDKLYLASSDFHEILEEEEVQYLQKEWIAIQEDMVRFVQEHASYHRNVLLRATFVDGSFAHPCSRSALYRMLQALPPLVNPRKLDYSNWMQFAAKMQDTNLEYVQRIHYPLEFEELSGDIKPFLHRCRSLKDLRVFSTASNTFQWAVEERNQYINSKESTLRSLVPLESLHIEVDSQSSGREANDAAYAFSSTLKAVTVNVSPPQTGSSYPFPGIELGHNWKLPVLRTLMISVFDQVLVIDPNALSECKALELLHILDNVMEYNPQEIQQWTAADLPCLDMLNLRGSAALSFHPDTFYHTPNLKVLEVSMSERAGCFFIPAIEEPEQGEYGHINDESSDDKQAIHSPVRWSWDWNLPNLVDLRLGAVFAYEFQFRILQRCPNLGNLTLDISTQDGAHRRHITLSDLMQTSEQGSDTGNLSRYVNLAKLTDLRFSGPWIFGTNVLYVLCHKVAPNIQRLTEEDCTGFDLKEFKHATDGLCQLMEAHSTLLATKWQLMALGLRPHSSVPTSMPRWVTRRMGLGLFTGPEVQTQEALFYFHGTEAILGFLETEIVNPASKFVERIAFEMPNVTDLADTYKGTWYLSPRQHTIEFVCYNVLFFVLFRIGLSFFRKKGSAFYSPRLDQLSESISTNVLAGHVMDKAVLALLCGSYALTVYHKVFGDNFLYLLQPCHVNLLLLIFTMVAPQESKVTRMAFNSYLHYLWATIIALSFPDTTENGLWFVIENFWLEHYLLLLVPIYLIYTGRFVVFPLSFSYAVFSYALFSLFHSFVLSGFGLLTGHNLNYMLVPPNSPIMHSFGKYYRLSIYCTVFFMCLVSRYILVEIASLGLRIKQWRKANALMRAQGIPEVSKELKLE
ncbi:hypothetical protein BGZ50_008096 [Haplosporangium sp. Z 11]|nr:hypothetical protein BGZ50_008096 [Haplosporangium sp. Z 11]